MTKESPLDHQTVQPDVPDRDPETTDRYPEVQAIVDRFVSPAAVAEEDDMDQTDAAELIAREADRSPVPESDTDTGWAHLAGLLGVDHPAVA